MQINSMLPALLNILTGQAGQNKVDRSNSKQGMGEVFREMVENPQSTAATEASRGVRGTDPRPAEQSSPGSSLPDFLPLPLKSPLFTESRFFIKNPREESSGEESSHCSVFVNLLTDSMGSLWIYLASGKESLAVSFYTEDESFTSLINQSIPALLEELKKIGYPTVKASGITRPGIKSCSDIAPGSAAPGNYLLDLEV
ncbi:MAG: flagellar hook-length control protein FliK [Firmicutes bacterium]|nr:flagellar hook-length control protein FliK [Bacillota bacterium]MCL5056780.1 flagellar hook-length control protein FliK [Actinomycetota bacterium]